MYILSMDVLLNFKEIPIDQQCLEFFLQFQANVCSDF